MQSALTCEIAITTCDDSDNNERTIKELLPSLSTFTQIDTLDLTGKCEDGCNSLLQCCSALILPSSGNELGIPSTIDVLKALSAATSLRVLKLGTELDLSSECAHLR